MDGWSYKGDIISKKCNLAQGTDVASNIINVDQEEQ